MRKGCVIVLLIFLIAFSGRASSILIPMDGSQKNHLKAYGLAFFVLRKGIYVDWLLNYRGGSFLIPVSPEIENECVVRGVSAELISDVKTNSILQEISSPALNMNVVRLETAPRIGVYSIKNELIKPTNVLSFPANADSARYADPGVEKSYVPADDEPQHLGDIVLAYETVAREAAEQGKSLADHLSHLVVHGLLHLVGHDHESDAEAETMEALERRILWEIGIADPYATDDAA